MKITVRSTLFSLLLLFTTLTHAVEQLPHRLIDFTSPEGQQSLDKSATSTSFKLLSHFITQKTTTYCGVASVVMALNASNLEKPDDPQHAPFHYFTQDDFFNERVSQILSPENPSDAINKVLGNGITLDQLGQIVQSFGLRTTVYHAADFSKRNTKKTDVENFKETLIDAISHQKLVIVNFARKGLGQEGGGHHSPIAAYDKRNGGRFLVLDVARYKYPSYWVSADDLWAAVNTTDTDANATRGFLVIEP